MLRLAMPDRRGPVVDLRLTSRRQVADLLPSLFASDRKAMLSKLKWSERTRGTCTIRVTYLATGRSISVEIHIPFGQPREPCGGAVPPPCRPVRSRAGPVPPGAGGPDRHHQRKCSE